MWMNKVNVFFMDSSHFSIVWMLVVSPVHTTPLFWVVRYGNFDSVRMLAVSPGVKLDIKVSLIHAYIEVHLYRQHWNKCIVLTLVCVMFPEAFY